MWSHLDIYFHIQFGTDVNVILFCAYLKKFFVLNFGHPRSFHICVTLLHTQNGIADKFITDVQECVKEIMKDPKASCRGAVSSFHAFCHMKYVEMNIFFS